MMINVKMMTDGVTQLMNPVRKTCDNQLFEKLSKIFTSFQCQTVLLHFNYI